MGSHRTCAGTRRRLVAAGLAVGLLAGAALGASLLSGAAPPASGPLPLVLHAAPALVTAETPVDLSVATFCETPDVPSCAVAGASLLVRASGAAGWAQIDGRSDEGVYRFRVPAELVPPEGFSYWIRLSTRDGGTLVYPPSGADAPIRVVTASGLPLRSLAAFDWNDRAAPTGTALRLPEGQGPGQVGFVGRGTEEGVAGPSSFEIAPDGSILVADWVGRRIERFGPDGGFRTEVPLPLDRPVDLALGRDGTIVVSTLGADAEAVEMTPDGHVLGRYPVGYGVSARIAGGDVPRVLVGNAQWVPLRGAIGVPLSAEVQGRAQTTTAPLADGSVGLSEELADGSVAVVWTRPDGSRGGAVLRLPRGVRAGSDFFVRPVPDGGAVVARGLWDDTHFGVGLIRLGATGRVRSFALLPAPSYRMDGRYSTVRYRNPREVLMAVDHGTGLRIDRFEVR